jgi:hypothetical protein
MSENLVHVYDRILPLGVRLAAQGRLVRVVPPKLNAVDLLSINFNLQFLAFPLAHLPELHL